MSSGEGEASAEMKETQPVQVGEVSSIPLEDGLQKWDDMAEGFAAYQRRSSTGGGVTGGGRRRADSECSNMSAISTYECRKFEVTENSADTQVNPVEPSEDERSEVVPEAEDLPSLGNSEDNVLNENSDKNPETDRQGAASPTPATSGDSSQKDTNKAKSDKTKNERTSSESSLTNEKGSQSKPSPPPPTRHKILVGQDPQPPPVSMSTTAEKKVLHVLSSNGVIGQLPGRKGSMSLVPNANSVSSTNNTSVTSLSSLPSVEQPLSKSSPPAPTSPTPPRRKLDPQQQRGGLSGFGSSFRSSFVGGKGLGMASLRLLGVGAGKDDSDEEDSQDMKDQEKLSNDVRVDLGDVETTTGVAGSESNENPGSAAMIEDYYDEEKDGHAVLMCEIFKNFCTPAPTLEQIEEILQYGEGTGEEEGAGPENGGGNKRRKRPTLPQALSRPPTRKASDLDADCPLPKDAVISMGEGCSSVARLLWRDPCKGLLQLPKQFQLAFFRILIRLLANEDNDEYNEYFSDLMPEAEVDQDQEAQQDGEADERNDFDFQEGSLLSSFRKVNSRADLLDEVQAAGGSKKYLDAASLLGRDDKRDGVKKGSKKKLDAGGKNNKIRFKEPWNAEVGHRFRRRNSIRGMVGRTSRLYSVVRFRCGAEWNRFSEKSKSGCSAGDGAVIALLELFRIITLDRSTDERKCVTYKHEHLLAPVARLLGLLCTAGMTAKELRHIMGFITMKHDDDSSHHRPLITAAARLYLIRALDYAADGADSCLHVNKASPRCFFNFGPGNGLSFHPNTPSWPWPFRNEYGFALWFRAEHFDARFSSRRPILFSMKTNDGMGVEVSLEVFSTSTSGGRSMAVSTLVVTVTDSDGSAVAKLQGCVLTPRIWYHVAVRHNCPGLKGYFTSARDEVTVFVDGKVMLVEELKFPRSLALSRGVRGSGNKATLQLGKDLDGQTGALYVFKDYVSDATIKALYEHTAGVSSLTKSDSNDLAWDSARGDLARKVLMDRPGDSEEVEVGNVGCGTNGTASMLDLDLGDDLASEVQGVKAELSRTFFASKICLVWDPSRSSGQVAVEAHLGAHAHMNPSEVQSWVTQGATSVIASIGGVQSLLPLFQLLLVDEKQQGTASSGSLAEANTELVASLVPSLFLLLASFLRNSSENAREFLRCGGVEIVEQCFHENKRSGLMAYLRQSSRMALRVVGAMIELRSATSHNLVLESKVFSRLLFNVPLWLGGVSESPGAALHVALLSTLSSIAKSSPNKVRDCVDVKDLLRLVNEVTTADLAKLVAPSDEKVDRFLETNVPAKMPLTTAERRHVVDLVLDIIATMTVPRTTVAQLGPLLNFISFNLDLEWEKASASKTPNSSSPRNEKYIAASKACMLFLFLLQCRPLIPDLYPSLEQCGGDANHVASWILCCMVNSFDDLIRSLGVRCLTAYLDGLSSVSLVREHSIDDMSDLPSDAPNESSRNLSQTPSMVVRTAKQKVVTLVGGNFGSSSPGAGDGKVNAKVVYKLLWHLLKCHRERLGDLSHAALVHLLVDDGTLKDSSSQDFGVSAVPNEVFAGGYKMMQGWTSLPITHVGVDSTQKLRSLYAVGTILRLLRFLPPDVIERWLFDLLALTRVSPSSIREIIPSRDWQPCLFHLLSEIVEELGRTSRLSLQKKEEDAASHDKTTQGTEDELKDMAEGLHLTDVDNIAMGANSAFNHVGGKHGLHMESVGEEGMVEIEELEAVDEVEDVDLNSDTDGDHGALVETGKRDENGLIHGVKTGQCTVANRYDLALKLYSTLLGHCVRRGSEKAYQAVEQAASLQRVCVNGHEVFCVLLSHLLNELTETGIVPNVEAFADHPSAERNRALKQSARVVTNAILLNGTNEMDLVTAVKHWRSLRHLTTVTVAVVTKSGFGVADLFDYRNNDASAVDSISGGLYGVRLSDGTVSGLGPSQVLFSTRRSYSSSSFGDDMRIIQRNGYRMMCVTLSSQLLSLLDAFIFPDSLDTSLPASQLHGLALVRSPEPRLGHVQGPLLASLLRLSLVLLTYLEPSSVKFLQCCGRLRCFLHWTLELIREAVALGGYSAAFQDLTSQLDRLVLAIVLQCHRALGKCSHVLIEMESTPSEKYFSSSDSRQKNFRRLFRATFELREIVLAVYRGRNEVLRAALSLEAYEALQAGLGEMNTAKQPNPEGGGKSGHSRKEAGLRAFLNNSWVQGFHDVEMHDEDLAIPEQVANGQVYKKVVSSDQGRKAIEDLSIESVAIVDEYNRALDKPFDMYCEDQRRWAETDAVRDFEYEGDAAVKRLAEGHKSDIAESKQLAAIRAVSARNRWTAVDDLMSWCSWGDGFDPGEYSCGVRGGKWKLPRHPDGLHRRILLVPNKNFLSHQDASYEAMLGREREKALKAEEERQKKRMSNMNMLKMASSAFYNVPAETDEAEDGEGIVDFPQDNRNVIHEEDEEDADEDEMDEVENKDFDGVDGAETTLPAGAEDSISWARSFIWDDREQVVQTFDSVLLVTLQTLTEGELLLTTTSIYFHPTGDEINVMTKEKVNADNGKDRRWRLNRLTEVHGRRYTLRAQALELFFADAHELFINFNNGSKVRDKFYSKLVRSCKTPMLRSSKLAPRHNIFKKSKLTDLWRRRKISNFQYIMQLNIMAGRTYNDITQYPVFPWILADYTSDKLNLNDPGVFRDLTKPVGALNPERLSQLIERYNDLDGYQEGQKFLYGSHYSSPGVVLYYLLRQEPFTSMAIDLQSGRFDVPDRLFYDIAGCWKSCLTLTSDVKELVPEFFTCPEVFMNTNKFPLGETQFGTPVDDVILPPWANGSAHEFVRMHRLALESEYVSQNLNHWIDLVFGYKQRGPEAVKANNVFHFLSYEGSVDLDTITDEVERMATESHIQNFGQTPSQLLVNEPHPSRYALSECWRPLCSEVSRLRHLRCWTPSKQFGVSESCGAVLSIQVLTDQVVVIYADLSVGTYKFSAKSTGRAPFYFKMDKLRALGSRAVSMSPASIFGSSVSDYSPSESRRDRMEAVAEQLEADEGRGGMMPIGNWSFGMTVGGTVKDTLNRRSTSAARTIESTISVDASSFLLSCGYWDDTLKIHTLDGLKLKCSAGGGHRGPINCLSMGNDGGLMVTGGHDATCRVWVVDHPVMAAALKDAYVQTALGGTLEGGHEKVLSCCHVLWGHISPVSCLSFSTDLDIVVSGSVDGLICVHGVREGKFIRSIRLDDGAVGRRSRTTTAAVRLLALDTTGVFVAYTDDAMLHIRSVNDARLCSADAGDTLYAMEICAGGEMLVTGGQNCYVVIRTLRDLGVRCVLDLSNHGPIRCISFTPAEHNPAPQYMYIGTDDGMVTIVDADPKFKDDDIEDDGLPQFSVHDGRQQRRW